MAVNENLYKKSDLVHVVDGQTGEVQSTPVPKQWLDTDLLPPGSKKATKSQVDEAGDRIVSIDESARPENKVDGAGFGPVTTATLKSSSSDSGSGDDTSTPITEKYGDAKVKQLEAEIDRRNEGRNDDAKISKSGNKDDLVKALKADDAAASGS